MADLPEYDPPTPLDGVLAVSVAGKQTKGTTVAVTGVELPGGGQTIFDNKRYVALYGHPLTGSLGVLGEQGPKGSVARVRKVAAQYEALAGETIVPAFEIIATVASGGAGDDGNYSNEWDVDVLRPLVDAAREAGIYVVLDLQSGRSDFLSQATRYEELLREPHDRDDVNLTHDELAVLVQMDGDGTLGQKLDTWRNLRAGAPEELRFGWKNFYDEDEPTPSPATTFQVQPKPWWVSYQ